MSFSNKLRNRIGNMTDTNLLTSITIVVFIIMYLGAILFLGEGFLKPQTFFNMLNANAALIILSCGMSLVMITGGIDISVGGVTALCCMCSAVFLDHHGGNVIGAILISVGIGLAFGLIQGYLISYLEIQPFIVTLAGMFFARGMTTIVNTNPFNVVNEEFVALKETRIIIPFMGYVNKAGNYVNAYIEIGVVVALLIVAALFFVLKWTKTGRNFYAVGGNRQSALMLGVNVKRTTFISYVLCGLLAGIGGFVYFMHVGSGSASHASGAEMNAIASSIIGGTMLTGGVGNIIGTLFGVMSLALIQNIVSSVGLDQAWWTGITIAAMLCLFLVIQSIVMSRKSGSVSADAGTTADAKKG
ncbi:MAG: sugar ABC transporter permease YjfF [Oscillospiraceae bacterium]|nr:sugar ABC transporter permease YjfF [Oscillospiraceae bacterium]MBR4100744.1 sugar ABC transporter permease YjfF [Oscillospiraceae bacterium]MBR6617654.1 sugar ABC transporter permease YjfF [Oscillospiraceae bacterium]